MQSGEVRKDPDDPTYLELVNRSVEKIKYQITEEWHAIRQQIQDEVNSLNVEKLKGMFNSLVQESLQKAG